MPTHLAPVCLIPSPFIPPSRAQTGSQGWQTVAHRPDPELRMVFTFLKDRKKKSNDYTNRKAFTVRPFTALYSCAPDLWLEPSSLGIPDCLRFGDGSHTGLCLVKVPGAGQRMRERPTARLLTANSRSPRLGPQGQTSALGSSTLPHRRRR